MFPPVCQEQPGQRSGLLAGRTLPPTVDKTISSSTASFVVYVFSAAQIYVVRTGQTHNLAACALYEIMLSARLNIHLMDSLFGKDKIPTRLHPLPNVVGAAVLQAYL